MVTRRRRRCLDVDVADRRTCAELTTTSPTGGTRAELTMNWRATLGAVVRLTSPSLFLQSTLSRSGLWVVRVHSTHERTHTCAHAHHPHTHTHTATPSSGEIEQGARSPGRGAVAEKTKPETRPIPGSNSPKKGIHNTWPFCVLWQLKSLFCHIPLEE